MALKRRSLVAAVLGAAGILAGVLAYGALASGSGGSVTVVANHLNNPRGLWATSDGSIYVAEAGKAGSQKVTKDTFAGFTSAVARWRPSGLQRVVKGLASAGGRDGTFTTGADAVALDPSGTIYVAMTGAPCGAKLPAAFKAQSRVFRIVPGGKPTVYKTGFNKITGLAFDKNGVMFVTEWSIDPTDQNNAKGDVVAVPRQGKWSRLGEGKLFFPAGAAVGADGALYVSNWSVLPGTPAEGGPFKGKTGELVRLSS